MPVFEYEVADRVGALSRGRAQADNPGDLILRFREPTRHRGFRAPGGLMAPVLSVVFCFLLMAGLPILTWVRFFGWLGLGLVFYFAFSRRNSVLAGK